MPPRRGFLANIAITSAGTMAGQLVVIVGAPFLARLFGPQAFGVASVFGTLVNIVAVAGCLRYDMAIPLPAGARAASALLGLSFLTAILFGLATAATFFLCGDVILQRFDAVALVPWWWVLGAGVTLTALVSPLSLFFQRGGGYGTVAGTSLAQNVCVTGGSIAVGALVASSGVALVLTRTAVQLVTMPAALVAFLVGRPRAVGWVRPRLSDLRDVARRYRNFPLLTLWAALLNVVARQAPPLILAALFNATAVGLYAMAARLITLPATFLSSSVAAVLFQHAAAERAEGRHEEFRRDILAVGRRLNAVGLPLVAGAAVLGPPVVTLAFGERWREAGQYVALLAPEVFAMFVTSPMTTLFNVLELHRANVMTQGGMLLVRSAALVLGARLTGSAYGALAVYAVLVPLGAGVQQAWLFGAAGISRRAYFGHLGRHVLYLSPTLLGWFALNRWAPIPEMAQAALTLVLGLSYVALAIREDPEVVEMARGLLRRLRSGSPLPPSSPPETDVDSHDEPS